MKMHIGLLQVFVFITFFYNSLISAVGINNLSPELKKALEDSELKSEVEDFVNKNSESSIEGLTSHIPISTQQSIDAEKFKNEYNGKDPKQLEGKGNIEMQSSENMKFLEKANGASSSIDRNDPAFSKYNNALKNNSVSKDCEEILGISGTEVEGGKDLPEFLEVEKTRQITRTNFDIKSCEDMKNKYSCFLILKPKCIRTSNRYLKFKSYYGTGITLSEYSHNKSIRTSSNRFAHSSFDFYFDIEDGIDVENFYFNSISSNNSLRVYFNGSKVFDGPNGLSYLGAAVFGKEHNSSISSNQTSRVRGSRNHILIEESSWSRHFYFDLSVTASVKECAEWKDVWEEECIHQK